MNNTIYQLAVKCKCISEDKMNTLKIHFPGRGVMYTDYTVKGAIDDYVNAIEELLLPLAAKYPDMGSKLSYHLGGFNKGDRIVHFTAMDTIVDCVIALEKNHSKRLFISHSSKDKEIMERFTDSILQLGIGLSHEEIFCTSIEEMGIKNGEDIRAHIRDNVKTADFSFLMISKNYKDSEICLNEMGAVWAIDNRVHYYLLPDVDFKEIGWLCDTKKAERLCDSVVLDTLEEELTSYYGLPHKVGSWSRQRQIFLEYLSICK